MDALEKYNRFMQLYVHPEFGKNSCTTPLGNQSINTVLTCGCVLVHHPLVARKSNPNWSEEKTALINAERRFFVTLCKDHDENINLELETL